MSSDSISDGVQPSPQPQPNQTPYQLTLHTLLTHPNGHIFQSPPTSPHKLLIPQTSTSPVPTISSLSLHPTIESLLHILNADLPSAHFLCRHAEVAPKWESMYVHGMLHRVEGDIDNTRAWYGNVCEAEIFREVWGGDAIDRGKGGSDEVPEVARAGWKHFLDRLERYRDRSARRRKLRRKSETGRVAGDDKDKDHLDSDTPGTSVPLTPPEDIKDWKAEAELLRATSLWEILRVLRFCERKFGTGVLDNAKGEFLGRIESGDARLQKIAEGMITGGEGWRVF